ncbi:MAG: glucose-1-phosphate adenylyltransferase [Gammaproteobacteria bacterium]|nr:glucose-1-phosphate adenylyltransferase [Gammaproteobacteria bacterium]
MARKEERSINRLIRDTLGVVMAGGRGARLQQLTARRGKPVVPFGGKFRIIDFTLSNCINSGIRRVCVLTQYNSYTLMRHIERAWSFLRAEFGEFVEVLPAQERFESSSWYQGTADAVYQNLDIILGHRPSYVLVLAGDHVYKMDYGSMIASHLDSGADATVGCVEIALAQARDFGLMVVDEAQRVVGFQEKPAVPQPMPGRSDAALASMGIYLFRTDFLVEILTADARDETSSHDFGRDVLPRIYRQHKLMAFPFSDMLSGGQGYWRDVGTVDAYWEANLELVGVTPPLNLYDRDWPIWTYQEQLPPAKFVFDDDDRRGMAVDSMVSAGCVVSGAMVRGSLLSNHVRINSYTKIEDSVLLPDVVVGRRCRIRRAVVDSGCRIPEGTIIGEDARADAERFYISPAGIVLVCPEMLGQRSGHAD